MSDEFQTKCLPVTDKSLEWAAELLKGGQVVAFPTETVYGLGANALNEEAVGKIFAAKMRPADNPLIVHLYDPEQMPELCEISEATRRLMEAFCPGPITMLCPKKPIIPDIVTANLRSVGIRFPSHEGARALLKACNLPIAAPSANLSTRPSPTRALHVLEDMQGRIPLILDGGDCQVGVESTVVDMTGEVPVVLRPGAVTPEMIAAVCGVCEVADSVMRPLREGESAPSPGMRHRHYAPRGKMTIVCGNAEAVCRRICDLYDQSGAQKPCILSLTDHIPAYAGRLTLDLGRDEGALAHNIFALLRRADELGIDRIFAEGIADRGVGLAVMNRMARAAAFDIEQV